MKKSRAKFNKFKHLRVWVNGKAYTEPSYMAIRKAKKGYWMDVGYSSVDGEDSPSRLLLSVRLYTRREVERAYHIVMEKLKAGEE